MKKTLATILALVMVLSVMSLTALAADEIKVDGDVSEWSGWVNVSAKDNATSNGTIQNTSAGKVTASYDYAVKVVGDTLYIAYKQAAAAIGNAEPAQTNCTNVRFWIDNDPSTTDRLGLIDFGFDGEKTVVTRNDVEGANPTVVCKADDNSYAFEAAIKLSELKITDKNFRYAFTVSSPAYAAGGSYKYSANNNSVTGTIPTDFLEANTTYTVRATAAFANVSPASGSVFVNYYYGDQWGDMLAVTADTEKTTATAKKDGADSPFTTGDTFASTFTYTIGAWGEASGDITVYSIEVLKGEEVVWSEKFETIPAGLEAGVLGGDYAALHSIKYEAGSEPWTTTAGFTVYSDTPAQQPPAGTNPPATGDTMMVFVLISLITIAGTVVAIKKVR